MNPDNFSREGEERGLIFVMFGKVSKQYLYWQYGIKMVYLSEHY